MSRYKYLKDVVTLELDSEKCIGCGMCLTVCPHEVWRMNKKKVHLVARDECMECGACALNCPAEAISVRAGVGCAAAIIGSVLPSVGAACCAPEKDSPGAISCG